MGGHSSERAPPAIRRQGGKTSARETLGDAIEPTPPLQSDPNATNSLDAADSSLPPLAFAAKPVPDSRKVLSTYSRTGEMPLIPNLTGFDGSNIAPLQRFIALQEGHEHYLEQKLRKESLFDRRRKILSKEQPLGDKKGPILPTKYGRCQRVVGYGTSGTVYVSRRKKENEVGEELYAVKELQHRSWETEDEYIRRLAAEFCILSELRHFNVIRTLELLTDVKGNYCEVMEYCEGGDLFTLFHSAGKLEVEEADCFFKQLMRGIVYLNEMDVVHRDLKPENLLLTRHGGLKISDFGNSDCFRMAWENEVYMMSGLCGLGPYIAPEVYMDQEYDGRAVDVWACGVIYIVMRTGGYLWRQARKDEDELFAQYLKDRRQEEGFGPIESLNPSRCRDVIYCMLDPNPPRRITASQVLRTDDLLACFVAGCALNWDGHYLRETEIRHDEVNSYVDVLLNFGGFMYIGAILPWSDFNDPTGTGITWGRLLGLGLLVLIFRRLPAIFAFYKLMPGVCTNWKEALFMGYFGPIGAGAVFYVEHARHLFPHDGEGDEEETNLVRAMGPTVYWLVLFSIIVHGLSIPALNVLYHYTGKAPIKEDAVELRRISMQVATPANAVAGDKDTFIAYNRFSRHVDANAVGLPVSRSANEDYEFSDDEDLGKERQYPKKKGGLAFV